MVRGEQASRDEEAVTGKKEADELTRLGEDGEKQTEVGAVDDEVSGIKHGCRPLRPEEHAQGIGEGKNSV